jgi:hypothetical protein
VGLFLDHLFHSIGPVVFCFIFCHFQGIFIIGYSIFGSQVL